MTLDELINEFGCIVEAIDKKDVSTGQGLAIVKYNLKKYQNAKTQKSVVSTKEKS